MYVCLYVHTVTHIHTHTQCGLDKCWVQGDVTDVLLVVFVTAASHSCCPTRRTLNSESLPSVTLLLSTLPTLSVRVRAWSGNSPLDCNSLTVYLTLLTQQLCNITNIHFFQMLRWEFRVLCLALFLVYLPLFNDVRCVQSTLNWLQNLKQKVCSIIQDFFLLNCRWQLYQHDFDIGRLFLEEAATKSSHCI